MYERYNFICSLCKKLKDCRNARQLSRHAKIVHKLNGVKIIPQSAEQRKQNILESTIRYRSAQRIAQRKARRYAKVLILPIMVIIGGKTGIGGQLAEIGLNTGYEVISFTRSQVIDGIGPGKRHHIHIDLSNENTFLLAYQTYLNILNGRDVSVLVSNAGIERSSTQNRIPKYYCQEILQVNFIGLIKFTQSILHTVPSGRVIIVSSVAGRGHNVPNQVRNIVKADIPYNTTIEQLFQVAQSYSGIFKNADEAYNLSKYLLNAATEVLAATANSDRTTYINSVDPGSIKSGMHYIGESAQIGAMNILKILEKNTQGSFYCKGVEAIWK